MPLTENSQTVAQFVRDETALAHQEVEELLLNKLHAIRSKEDYAYILKIFYGYYHPLEAAIQQKITPIDLSDIKERRSSAFILADLEIMNMSGREIPLCSNLPTITGLAEAFGAMYVLEGSTLGGKMIAKMLLKNRHLGLSDHELHFFTSYGELTGSKWLLFLDKLNQQPDRSTMVKTANQTFLHLKTWIQESFCNEQPN